MSTHYLVGDPVGDPPGWTIPAYPVGVPGTPEPWNPTMLPAPKPVSDEYKRGWFDGFHAK